MGQDRAGYVSPTYEGLEDLFVVPSTSAAAAGSSMPAPVKAKPSKKPSNTITANPGLVDMATLQMMLESVAASQQELASVTLAQLLDHQRQSQTSAPQPRGRPMSTDFMKEARIRKISFSGNATESLRVFTRAVEELMAVFPLSEAEMRRVLPDLFCGAAAQWYRVHQEDFKNWKDVCKALKANYLKADHSIQLSVLLHTRQQDPHERVIHYITQMRAINADLEEPLSEERVVQLIKAHVHPKISRAITFQNIRTYRELETACMAAEAAIDQEKSYCPPSVEQLTDPLYGDEEAAQARRKKSFNPVKIVSEPVAKVVPTPAPQVELEPLSARDSMQSTLRPRDQRAVKPSTLSMASRPMKPEAEWQCKGCGLTGHYEQNCPTTPRPFCFRCGKQRTVVQKCCPRPQPAENC